MPALYLLRHGETEWNRTGRIQGWAYTRLNDTGRRQAAAAGAYLADVDPPVEAIYSSDLPRAMETLEALQAQPAFADCPVTTDRAFRERDFGVFQGFDTEGFFDEHPELSILYNGDEAAHVAPEGGESYAAFDERVVAAYDGLREQLLARGQSALLVTHGGVISRLIAHIRGLDYETEIETVSPDNCSVTKLRLTSSGATIEYQSRTGFLGR